MFKLNMYREKPKFKTNDESRTKSPKAGRLVVRNLPFKITENDVKELFSTFGDLEDVHFLRRNDVFTGCAFVQFSNKLCAAKALAKTSGRDFKGRTVIVDWAVSKDRYNKIQADKPPAEVKEEVDSSDDEKPDVNELNRSLEGRKKVFESDSDDDVKEEPSDEVQVKSEEEDDSSGEEQGDESNDGSDSSDDESKPDVKPKVVSERFLAIKRKHQEEDQLNLRTLFVKNVPFSATNKDFRKAAEEAGRVSYALVVMDQMTEHSRGTGFIRYEDAETAERVLSGEVNLSMNGIELMVQKARSKNDVHEKPGEGNKVAKDSRNLYLAKEGVILAESSAAEGVSEGDMSKRLKLEQWKTTVLRNLHMFISPNRLVVHNIPSHYTDKTLFSLFKKHSPKGAMISEARIMKNVNDKEVGLSKGYGFVNYHKHEDALTALRKVNNNPEVFSAHRRPIVAFSVENRKALNIKEKRRQMSLNNLNKKPSEDAPSENTSEGKKSSSNPRSKKNKQHSHNSKEPSAKRAKPATTADVPKFAGMASKFGNKKLRSKRQLLSQAAKHRQAVKKAKKQKKVSRKQKRTRRAKTSII